ncbi:MAG: DUF4397 domain-containing protein [Puia sp.]|nr:DUF4397 domain-containing protein [Puia sp.]
MKKKNSSLLPGLAVLAFISFSFSSCLKSSTSGSVSTSTPMTYISILNLAPYAPAVDVIFNGTTATQNLNPDTYFSSYSQVNPGAYDIKFVKDGSDSLVSEIPTSQYDSLNFYTLVLYNTSHNSTQAIAIHDNFSNVTNSYSYYRFFNMNPDLGGVDLYLSNALVQSNRKPADNANAGSTYNYFQGIQPGYYTVILKATGTDSLIASATSIDISAGNVYTFMLAGKGANSTFNVLPGTY